MSVDQGTVHSTKPGPGSFKKRYLINHKDQFNCPTKAMKLSINFTAGLRRGIADKAFVYGMPAQHNLANAQLAPVSYESMNLWIFTQSHEIIAWWPFRVSAISWGLNEISQSGSQKGRLRLFEGRTTWNRQVADDTLLSSEEYCRPLYVPDYSVTHQRLCNCYFTHSCLRIKLSSEDKQGSLQTWIMITLSLTFRGHDSAHHESCFYIMRFVRFLDCTWRSIPSLQYCTSIKWVDFGDGLKERGVHIFCLLM